MKKLIHILLPLLLLVACTDDPQVLDYLNSAEALMEEFPDSAYTLLADCDSLIPQQSKSARMRHLMLITEAENKLYQPLPSDTLFSAVIDYYDHHGTHNQQLKAHYLLGCIYRDMKEAPKALQCYYDAVEKADTMSNDCDYNTLYKVYGQMAMIFRSEFLTNQELKSWRQYYYYAQKAGDIYGVINGLEQMLIPYFSQNDTNQIWRITEECVKLYRDNGMAKEAARVYPTAILARLNAAQYKKAHDMMVLYEQESDLFGIDGNIAAGGEHYYYSKGLYYMGVHLLDSAEYFFRKLMHHGYQYDACKGLLYVYQTKNVPDSTLRYAMLCEKGLEQLLSDNKMKSVLQLSKLYDYTHQQNIAEEKTREAERGKYIILGISVTSVLIIVFGCWRYTRYRKLKAEEIKELNANYLNAMQKMEQASNELDVLRDSYSDMKEHVLKTKQEEIKTLQNKIREYRSRYELMESREKEEALLKSEIVKSFWRMAHPTRHSTLPNKTDWEQLTMLLQQCLPSFHHEIFIVHPLKGQELYTAILTRLAFPPGETAVLLDTLPQRISTIKRHLNKKLFGEENASTLYQNMRKARESSINGHEAFLYNSMT